MPRKKVTSSVETSAAEPVAREITAVAVSGDYDCCTDSLWCRPYGGRYRYVKQINEDNPLFIDFHTAFDQVSDPEKKFFLVGSNRQSWRDNISNLDRNGNGCCFEKLQQLCEHLGVKFNTMLMADIKEGRELGHVMKAGEEDKYSYSWHWDEYKFTLLYAQMQAIAEQYPNDVIEFRFMMIERIPYIR